MLCEALKKINKNKKLDTSWHSVPQFKNSSFCWDDLWMANYIYSCEVFMVSFLDWWKIITCATDLERIILKTPFPILMKVKISIGNIPKKSK